MCGITGYITNQKLPLDEMLFSLKHRGPDAQGIYETNINNKYIGLGHTRLSILDLLVDELIYSNQHFQFLIR